MNINQEENSPAFTPQNAKNAAAPIPFILKVLGLILLVVGFAGPWVYGPIGKSNDWGWQPVWGMLLSFWGLNLVIIFAAISCFCYVELYYRLGRPPLSALLKWIGGFLGLVIVLPLLAWTIVDQSGRSPNRLNPDGSLGWGVWLALVGLVALVVGLRLQINQVRKMSDVEPNNVER
ncbi:MAG: hypothetical protein J0I20_28280 [Chloroflexi bacterium]|mgnify:CR=1 FL=1|nr:hypothetical protein [Chloroflexota bacterium]OJV97583.1 MAG: hypothetical protein BGO39_07410 [Chloroflexi bacterium 54-19]